MDSLNNNGHLSVSERISTWPFCALCGSILDPPKDDEDVSCSVCPFTCSFEAIKPLETFTRSAKTKKQPWVVGDVIQDDAQVKHAVIEEPCPKCNHPELYFYTMQLRSVDEGSTVFYECKQCGHKFSQNN